MKELLANSQIPGGLQPIATLAAAVTTTPAAGTTETWTFSAPPPSSLQVAGQYRFVVGSEICIDVTQGGGITRQIQRGAEGSTISTHGVGTGIYHVLTVGGLQQYIGGQQSWINPTLPPYKADPTGGSDATAAFNAAAADGPVATPPGNYRIDGVVSTPLTDDFTGCGPAATVFKLGASGQIKLGAGGSDTAATAGGFTVDGQNVQNVVGGGLYVLGGMAHFKQIAVRGCNGDGAVFDTIQNCIVTGLHVFPCGGRSLVCDGGAGGLRFYAAEINGSTLGGVVICQSHASASGAYATFEGSSDIHFNGSIFEYPVGSASLLYVTAGTDHSLTDCSINGPVIMEQGGQSPWPVVTTQITGWNGSTQITVADATGITGLMTAKVPYCPTEIQVQGVSGNTITLNVTPSSSPVGGNASFGAFCTDLSFDGEINLNGSVGQTCFDTRGLVSIYMNGRMRMQGFSTAYKMRASDRFYLKGAPPLYEGVTTIEPQQNTGDTAPFASDVVVADYSDVMQDVRTRWGAHRAFMAWRLGDSNPHTLITPGQIGLSDGTRYPENAVISYLRDGSGGEWLQIPGTSLGLKAPSLAATGFAGLTTQGRFVGVLPTAAPPTVGTWEAGAWALDPNGGMWVCTVAGSPGTWVNPVQVSSPTPTLVTASGAVTIPTGVRNAIVVACGGGGGGGGAGSAAATQLQAGGGGGGAGAMITQRISLAGVSGLTATIGGGSAGGTGGAAGGNAGNGANAGANTTLAGTGLSTITAPGGGGGASTAASSASTAGGGVMGVPNQASTTSAPASGGRSTINGGSSIGYSGSGGGGGGAATTTNGGSGGAAGVAHGAGGAGSGSGGSGTSAGTNGANAAANTSAGGGGGGGGAAGTGAGGAGGTGGSGFIQIQWLP